MSIQLPVGGYLPLTGGTLSGTLMLASGIGVALSTTSFAAWSDVGLTRNSSGTLEVNNGTSQGSYRDFICRQAITQSTNGGTRLVPTTVSGLPSASGAGSGSTAVVTDANATTFNSIVAGGGSSTVPVFSDGTNWRIG